MTSRFKNRKPIMNLAKIEESIQTLVKNLSKDSFIYDLLLAYGLPKASITRLKDGAYNLSKKKGEILWKNKLLFQEIIDQDLHAHIDQLRRDATTLKHSPRFLIVTDYTVLLAYDTKTKDTLDTRLADLPKNYDFFLPWSGREKAQNKPESEADVKAAEKMARLYDVIRQDNPEQFLTRESLHELNVFLSRLLFCYFAEDTEIFPKKLFVGSIESHTNADGSDLTEYLERLFLVLNTKSSDRAEFPEYLKKFEYVNGGLFADNYKSPKFSPRSRKILIECGELDWSEINPDIFGSMIQAVVHPDQRGGMGMHYTSVSNIMKVIEPLFLNELHEEFESNQHNPQKLEKLLSRLSSLRIFDPACGSGNFLIIAYKELRILEMKILKQLKALSDAARGLDDVQASLIPKAQMNLASSFAPQLFSRIHLAQFFGIELDDFAHEIAILSLWLAEHQMNIRFNEEFHKKLPSLPLKQGGKIICDNATRINWEDVCPKDDKAEIYILGNPPYLGYGRQTGLHKSDMEHVFRDNANFRKLDYISCWFIKASNYIVGTTNKLAFVTTNSLSQGVQVELLWPKIFEKNLCIFFSYPSFKWSNNAKLNAGVYVAIIGITSCDFRGQKTIFANGRKTIVNNINPYLVSGKDIFVLSRSNPISKITQMVSGLKAGDDGNLILSKSEKGSLLEIHPQCEPFIKRYIGASDFMNGIERYCIWVTDDSKDEAYSIKPLRERFEKCREFRLKSKKIATQKKAATPHSFDETNWVDSDSILIPQTGSEKRDYLPIGFLKSGCIISNGARIIYNAEPWLFALLSSKIHITWVKAVAGRLKMDMQYSNTLCYNTFPVPDLSEKQKETITTHVLNVLEERENHSEKTMAELYDPRKMPKGLREAHEGLDQAIERCYRQKPFASDEERLEYLFKLYEEMTRNEKKGGV